MLDTAHYYGRRLSRGAEWQASIEYHDNRCAYCGQELGSEALQKDHIVPKSKGGKHGPENIVPACHSCNGSKSAKSLLAFLYSRQPEYKFDEPGVLFIDGYEYRGRYPTGRIDPTFVYFRQT